MDAMVTARVPVEIKEQGNAILREIGSSPSKLVNAAYEYVLKTRRVPEADVRSGLTRAGRKNLSDAQKARLRERSRAMKLGDGSDVLGGRSFKDALAEMRCAEYEALS